MDDEAWNSVRRLRVEGTTRRSDEDLVACEEPLEIQVNGLAVAVVMRTPGDDHDLVRGFLLSERIVPDVSAIQSMRHGTEASRPEALDNVLQVTLDPRFDIDLDRVRRRSFASSSCGVCGKATLDAALNDGPGLDDDPRRFSIALFSSLGAALREQQALFSATGGCHGVALFTADGGLLVAREDVGRHNALDKVIGWSALHERGDLVMLSGRVSYEMVQKALAARIPCVAAVSAPTSLAVALAERAQILLVTFLRGDTFSAYGAVERLTP